MRPQEVQSLVLRAPAGPAVAHQILRIPEGSGVAAACLLHKRQPSFGAAGAAGPCCSIGFSFAGLEALGVPESYLRLFRRLAPAFSKGAVQRSVHLGDSGINAPTHWRPEFRHEHAHVVLSWHGQSPWVAQQAGELAGVWKEAFEIEPPAARRGARLGHPPGEEGEWVHFGFRDGLSEVCIDGELPRPDAPDCREHAPGELLLGEINDAGYNPFALSRKPDKVRLFFRDSSFGILRPMKQNLVAFEEQIDHWVAALPQVHGKPVTRDFVKAKLCGRWPSGQQARPGQYVPQGDLVLSLAGDDAGEGCPFGSHVRRMRAASDRYGFRFERPLQRRGVPFGTAVWSKGHKEDEDCGLLGHFFCASIESQFEHLLGQWATRPPLGFAPDNRAQDPLVGPHEDADAALAVPLPGHPTQSLRGFGAWTTTQGTMYAWYPSRSGLKALLEDDFVPAEDEEPWL